MRSVDLKALRAQFEGTSLAQLVEHHLRRQSQSERINGMQGTLAMLPPAARDAAEQFIDEWNAAVYVESYWQRDTADVFDEIISAARETMRPSGFADDDEAAFNLFNLVVLNYAYNAYTQPKLQRFMKIEAFRVPWVSAVSLLYPAYGVWAIASTPAGPLLIAGYGTAALGYTLIAAGIFAGTFRIFGLKRRLHVFGAGACALIIGTLLSNVGD